MVDDIRNRKRLPEWIRKDLRHSRDVMSLKKELREHSVHTVCEEAKCPNLSECFGKKKTATFLIMGDICTRNCTFCAVEKNSIPGSLDRNEPDRIAEMVSAIGLEHAVITSVTRDDLPDGGSGQFAQTIKAVRKKSDCTIEVLTPDFGGSADQRIKVSEERPDIFNHNVETVRELYYKIRPMADYRRSLDFLMSVKKDNPNVVSKSGIMVGLGETDEQLKYLLYDLSEAGVDILTCGQYLRPSEKNIPVFSYPDPEWFDKFAVTAKKIGIKYVFASPFTRSSYNAAEVMKMIKGLKDND